MWDLPDEIPVKLRDKAVSLEKLGVDQPAWEGRDALDVIESLVGSKVAVLRGEVYPAGAVKREPCHAWTCPRFPSESATDYAQRSRQLARHHVAREAFFARETFHFVLHLSEQQDAA